MRKVLWILFWKPGTFFSPWTAGKFSRLEPSVGPEKASSFWGRSGSGKSVLLSLKPAFWRRKKGAWRLGGSIWPRLPRKRYRACERRWDLSSEDAALISNMSIFDNVALPLRYHTRLGEPEVQARVSEKMALFEVDRRYDRSIPAQISLGMRKRAALARALVLRTRVSFPG